MKLNEYVSYPGHGIGQITELRTMHETEFVSILILDSGLKIMVPRASNVIRPLMDKFTAKKCLLLIREPSEYSPDTKNDTWQRRYRIFMEKIKSNNPIRIAEIVAELYIRKLDGNDLSFGERKMIDAARSLLAPELKLVLDENI